MQIVIDIPKTLLDRIRLYQTMHLAGYIKKYPDVDFEEFARLIYDGKPLPETHGRLIDADKTLEVAWQNFYKHEEEWEEKDEDYIPLHRFYDQNGFECCQQTIVNAPTIIEADKEKDT